MFIIIFSLSFRVNLILHNAESISFDILWHLACFNNTSTRINGAYGKPFLHLILKKYQNLFLCY